jgi:predicted nucleic acid-binding protein
MILTDTGPLVALIDANDPNHARCLAAARQLPQEPLLTTWSCLTEAMYFLHKEGGYPAQRKLWNLRRAGSLVVFEMSEVITDRVAELMEQYRDIPMDIADASLVSVAEAQSHSRIFTLDTHSYAYKRNGKQPFEVIP